MKNRPGRISLPPVPALPMDLDDASTARKRSRKGESPQEYKRWLGKSFRTVSRRANKQSRRAARQALAQLGAA